MFPFSYLVLFYFIIGFISLNSQNCCYMISLWQICLLSPVINRAGKRERQIKLSEDPNLYTSNESTKSDRNEILECLLYVCLLYACI